MRGRGDRGSIAIELAVIFPFIFVFASLVVGAGWLFGSRSDVAGAAQAGARAAATARSGGEMLPLAQQAADAALRGSDTCSDPQVSLGSPTNFEPGGQVTVVVACDVPLGQLATVRIFPDSRRVSASATATIDQYRVVE